MFKIIGYTVFLFICYTCAGQHTGNNIFNLQIENTPTNQFIPREALGAAFDGHSFGDMDRILTKDNIRAMDSVGLHPISYRLRTELAGEAWHWNPSGHWSNQKSHEGYWVSDNTPSQNISVCYGYRLPRRGNTHDQANDDGYSRIDDGDTNSFWKSNPYLDNYFTVEKNIKHPQWVIVDLGKSIPINAIRIVWGDPYAVTFTVDYALDTGPGYFDPYTPGLWHLFPNGHFKNERNNKKIRILCQQPISIRFIKITMTESSYTNSSNDKDIRSTLGFAIKEIEAGRQTNATGFKDYIQHGQTNKTQSVIYVSSTDPWHTESDKDSATEQAGIDRFFLSGLTHNTPAMLPLGLLYDTPENMMSLLQYVKKKGYAVSDLELGEEPEGQLIHPNDYACLYYQWAVQAKKIFPETPLGGPGFAAISFSEEEENTFTEREWTILFLDYLKSRQAIQYFNFFSTEWYPFDDICNPPAPQLLIAPHMLQVALGYFQKNVLPQHTPIYLTEYGYSAYSGISEVKIEGALMYADIIGKFLTLGGTRAYLYGYEPTDLEQTHQCNWGNNMLFGMNDTGRIIYHTAAYYGMSMITHDWAIPQNAKINVYPVRTLLNGKPSSIVSCYALMDSNHKWSLMIINKDPVHEHRADLSIYEHTTSHVAPLSFEARQTQYSKEQYKWLNLGPESHPAYEHPPAEKDLKNIKNLILPPYSLTIIHEK